MWGEWAENEEIEENVRRIWTPRISEDPQKNITTIKSKNAIEEQATRNS